MQTYKITLDVSESTSHIGADTAGIGVENVREWVHSDTLFSAIVHAFAKKFGYKGTSELLDKFAPGNDPPFRCSSAFLAKNKMLFVPKPRQPLPESCDWSAAFKVSFISLDRLYQWLGIVPLNWNDEEAVAGFFKQLELESKTYRELFVERVRAVNAKSRKHNQTQVYHRGEVIYTKGTSLYFFLEVSDTYRTQLEEALQFMVDYAGLGGEISVGFSQIKSVKWEPFSFPPPAGKTGIYLLSLYPVYAEVEWDRAWYDVLTRKSWFNSPFNQVQLKKKAVKMLAEGSCLPSLPNPGELIDVSPDEWVKMRDNDGWHPIYRYGFGYTIAF